MTGKVQTKDKKRNSRKYNDGLSKEERQRRYDNKACLGCGELGHFRRDCPGNEVSKQAVVKIKMLRAQPSILPSIEELNDNLSDMDLYEEARLDEDDDFEMVPRPARMNEVTRWATPEPTDWRIEDKEIDQRLSRGECWVCGDATHVADTCAYRARRLNVTGTEADAMIRKAFEEQPFFVDPTLPAFRPAEDYEREEELHQRLHWVDCRRDFCMYHTDEKERSKLDEYSCCHMHLWADECPMLDCHIHKEEHQEAHERLEWINCVEKCRFHREQRIAARQESHYLHRTITAKECRTVGCKMHDTTKDQIPTPETLEEMMLHMNIHWTFCTEDQCTIHYDAKADSGFFPRETDRKNRDRRRANRTTRTREQTPGRELVPHRHSDWRLCYRDACPDHLAAKQQAGRFPKERKRSEKGRRSQPKN